MSSFFRRILHQDNDNSVKRKDNRTSPRQEKKRTGQDRSIALTREVADGIITFAKSWHPNEGILILRGSNNKGRIMVDGLVVPPFASHGPFYSGFPNYDLPFDLSYIGTAHSHPGGSNRPSLQDLHSFFGLVSVIICFPYDDRSIGAFDRNGKPLPLSIH